IIAKVNAITSETFAPLSKDRQGTMTTLADDVDEAYMQRLETLIVDPSVILAAKSLHIIYTPIHGTGGVIIKPALKRLGFNFQVVEEQDRFDGAFPTVKSPNPENADALKMGIELAKKKNADLVIATDPDCDRVGVAVRAKSNKMQLLTGNQIGSLLAWYRVKTLFDRGVLHFRRRRKLWLQCRRFRARQGWQWLRDYVLRSCRLRKITRADDRSTARRNLCQFRLFRGEKRLAPFRRSRRRKENRAFG